MTIQFPKRQHQRGVSLVIVLVLLLIVTLLGLASLRGTLLEERMSANLYDRSLAFQSAERALREGEALVRGGEADLGQDCTDPAVVCPIPNANTGEIAGCATCWSNAKGKATGDLAPGVPQYYIQRMRQSTTTEELQQDKNAALTNEGAPGGSVVKGNYRVFARSHDPASTTDRAIVVLQGNLVRK